LRVIEIFVILITLIGTSFDGQVFDGLKSGSKAVEQLNKQMNLDEFEELKD
jgi:hypothetical protein